jgi:hypothetical protein
MKVGSDLYLISDLRLRCAGPTYNTASAFNILFVLVFVVGWPAFLVWCDFVLSASGRAHRGFSFDLVLQVFAANPRP